jgi:4-carboxymuconolactone decarboxylase
MRESLIAIGGLIAAMPLCWIAANTASSQAIGKEPRFPQLTLEQLNDQQRPLGEKIIKISSVGLGGPYNPMLRSPVYAQRMYDLLDYLRWHTSVPTKLNEMAILIIARQWRSQVEWFAHAPLAKKAGLADSIIADLKANQRPAGMSPDEEVVYDFVTDLTTKHAVSDELFERAKTLLGETAGRRSDGRRRNLCRRRHDPRDGGRRRPCRQRGAFQGQRALSDNQANLG